MRKAIAATARALIDLLQAHFNSYDDETAVLLVDLAIWIKKYDY